MIFVNINEHPTNNNKKVFFYKDVEHANHFEFLLIESKIKFEKQIDEEGDQVIYFGVHKVDFEKVKRINYLTLGKFRQPFIPDKVLRIFVILISILVLGLAFVGAWVNS